MKSFIYFLILLLSIVSSDDSPSFCLCTLKDLLKDYALLTTDRTPPRYHSSLDNDIGFYVVPSNWKAVNNATWIEIGVMLNAPEGMYTQISLDGINPINDGSSLDGLRSAHLADIIADYRSIISKVEFYHENIIKNRTPKCLEQTKKSAVGSDIKNKWQQFFLPPSN
jgi:hypothetical protein